MSDIIQRSFSGGEIAPSLWARADQSKYATGLRTCRNFMVHKHGGVSNRAGTEFDAETKDSTKISRLVSFKFSNAQRYAMEFGEGYIRFHQSGGQIMVTNADAPAYNGATAYVIGDLTTSLGIRYYCIAGTTGNAPPNGSYWYPLTGDIYEIPTTYTVADLFSMRFTQSADVVTIVHPSHDPRELSRFGNVRWTLAAINFAPPVVAPTGGAAVIGVAGPPNIVWRYKLSTISDETGEESVVSASFSCTGTYPSFTAPNTLTWVAATGAGSYRVYKEIVPGNGVYGLIGIAATTSFNDINIAASSGDQPITNKTPFAGANNKPSVVAHYQQRRVFGATNNDPETVNASKSGSFSNMSTSTPLKDDDAVEFSLAGESVNRVVGLVGLRKLVILTEAGEHTAEGNASGTLTPGQINPQPQGYNGGASLHPVVVGNEVLYVQARGSIVRSLSYELTADGYKGDDISLFATHLFEGRSIVDWAYAQEPDSIIWAVMDDGALLGLTYIKAQQIWGWHRHDTGGDKVESVCVIPEGDEDYLYMIVNRTIAGATKRYVERLHSRLVIDTVYDSFFVDSGLTYDGTNYNPANTMTLTGGTLWDSEEYLTLTAASSAFGAGDVGNRIVLVLNGVLQKLDITGYTSGTVVTVQSVNDVAVQFRAVAVPTWSKAIDVIDGLSHLNGRALSVLGDGSVVGNGVDAPLLVVTAGAVNLGGLYSVVHAGLPITSDFETLSIDSSDQRTLLNKESLVPHVDLVVKSSRGIWVGPDANHLTEYKQRTNEDYGAMTDLTTGVIGINVDSTYCLGGRIFVRQRDPLPVTILAAIPVGNLGGD